MNVKAISLVSLIVLALALTNPSSIASVQAAEVYDIKALFIIADYFGWNYYDVKDLLESWGANVTTIANSLDTDVPSCLNKPPRGTSADLLLNQVDNEIVKQFDILLIPAGGQWNSLVQSTRTKEFIEYAFNSGVIIAAICIGNKVLANANDIVNNSNVVSYTISNFEMTNAGAITRAGYRTVIDNHIITGGTGGGPTGGGFEVAPTEEVCIAAVRQALGYSFIQQASISPQDGAAGTNFTITAEITDLDDLPIAISSGDQNISSVSACVYSCNPVNLVSTVELTDADNDGIYSGSFMETTDGAYEIDIEVEDTNGTLEVNRGILSLSIGYGIMIDPIILASLASAGLIAVAVVIFLKRKQLQD